MTTKTDQATIWRDILKRVHEHGDLTEPRGMKVKELNNFSYILPPYVRFMNFKSRKLNIEYIKQEFQWYLHGNKYDVSIVNHAKMWRDLINNDGSINSNYGQYIFGCEQQFWNVVHELESDKDSRRASITILDRYHLSMKTKDLPCTYALNFRIRHNQLHMTVHMRSQDAIFGMGNDAPAFSFVHEMVYVALKEKYKDLEMGSYYHFADSFHVYERHFEMLDAIVAGDSFEEVEIPRISCYDEVYALSRNTPDLNDPRFEFTRWLYSK